MQMADELHAPADAGPAVAAKNELDGVIAALEERAYRLRKMANVVFALVVLVVITGIALFGFARHFAGDAVSADLSRQFHETTAAMSTDAAQAATSYARSAELADRLVDQLRASGCEDRTHVSNGGAVTFAFLSAADMRHDRGLSRLAALVGDSGTSTPFYFAITTPVHIDEATLRASGYLAVTAISALKCTDTLRTSSVAQSLISVLDDAEAARRDYEVLKQTRQMTPAGRGIQPIAQGWHSILDIVVARISCIVIMIGIVLVLLPQSRFQIRLAGFYQARADALRLNRIVGFSPDAFLETAFAMTPQAFMETSAPPPPPEGSSLFKKLRNLSVTKK